MKFGQNMDLDDPNVDLEGQGHRSKVKGQGHQVKKHYFRSHSTTLQAIYEVKGHMGHGQRSHGSRSKVALEGQGHQVKNVISGPI